MPFLGGFLDLVCFPISYLVIVILFGKQFSIWNVKIVQMRLNDQTKSPIS